MQVLPARAARARVRRVHELHDRRVLLRRCGDQRARAVDGGGACCRRRQPGVVHDVLRRSELMAVLGGRRAFDRALDTGAWQRLLRGTYAPGSAVPDLRLRAAAAALLLPDGAVVADRCLLWLLGVDVLPPGPPALEVVVPRAAVVPRRLHVQARAADVPGRDLVRLGPQGVPCLRPERAFADLVRLQPLAEGVVVADAARREGRTGGRR